MLALFLEFIDWLRRQNAKPFPDMGKSLVSPLLSGMKKIRDGHDNFTLSRFAQFRIDGDA